MRGVDELGSLLAPLDSPAGPADWSRTRSALGTGLPGDYVEFIDRFGPGTIDDFLHIYGPVETSPYVDLARANADGDCSALAAWRTSRSSHPESVPYPLWPEPGGLLVVGHDDDGEFLFWRTEGHDPDAWTIVAGGRQGEWFDHDGGLVDLLVAVLDGRIVTGVHPDGFPAAVPASYRPFS